MTELIELVTDDEFKKTQDSLSALESGLQVKAIRAGLHAAGNILVREMKTTAPDNRRTSGNRLALAINKTQIKTGGGVLTGAGRRAASLKEGEVGLVVGPNKKVKGRSVHGAAAIVEWGAKAHKISSKNNVLVVGRSFITGTILHPGAKPQNWMSGAFDAVSSQMNSAFYQGLEKWLNKNGR